MLVPHWGGHLMNVYTQDYAWPKHVLDYVRRECLTPGGYDGLMMDCLWQSEPDQQDVNGDGVHDQRDTQAWQEGMLFLLRNLREQFPDAILTGNGGGPWSDDCPYYEFANGCMHENALGDQFGGVEWQNLWDGYRRTVDKVKGREPFHLMAVDVQPTAELSFRPPGCGGSPTTIGAGPDWDWPLRCCWTAATSDSIAAIACTDSSGGCANTIPTSDRRCGPAKRTAMDREHSPARSPRAWSSSIRPTRKWRSLWLRPDRRDYQCFRDRVRRAGPRRPSPRRTGRGIMVRTIDIILSIPFIPSTRCSGRRDEQDVR